MNNDEKNTCLHCGVEWTPIMTLASAFDYPLPELKCPKTPDGKHAADPRQQGNVWRWKPSAVAYRRAGGAE
jgi:hypothetical protein